MQRGENEHFYLDAISFGVCAVARHAAARHFGVRRRSRKRASAWGWKSHRQFNRYVLWEAGPMRPRNWRKQKRTTRANLIFVSASARGADSFLYLVATGGVPKAQKSGADNPAIALLAVLGNKPPDKVVINEFTTIASVWTNAQFLDGPKLQGNVSGSAHCGRQCAEFCGFANRWLGRGDSRPAKRWADSNDGQFRHAGRCTCWLCDPDPVGRLQQFVLCSDVAKGRVSERHAGGSGKYRTLSLVST